MSTPRAQVLVAGGGPAGLTAAYELAREGVSTVVVDDHVNHWGGISRTESYRGYRFDIGGHRFFSKSAVVEQLWNELLPEPMLERPRKSRIYYGRKFYSYPLKPFEALANLGLVEASRCTLSYARARMRPIAHPRTFEEWVTNAFGQRLFEIFFKTYTEKVWGMNCRDISADWAAQRIRGLSLGKAVWHALRPARTDNRASTVKTLINTFRYPRLGPGMMWEAAAAKIGALGGDLRQGTRVSDLSWDAQSGQWNVGLLANGARQTLSATSVVSSIPMRTLCAILTPSVSAGTLRAANALRYRDFLTVALIVRERNRFDDNWIYVHEPGVRVGRIQNYKSWSPDMVPDPTTACYGMEYFCNDGDDIWSRDDSELVQLAADELDQLGLANRSDVLDGTVVRQLKAYPVYDEGYAQNVATIRTELERRFPTLHLVGRNGMHKYNNQDHAMMTAMLAARNIIAGSRVHDAWKVNEDAEYHEEGEVRGARGESGLRSVPQAIAS